MDYPLLVYTDLDGSLLDHHSYSFKGAEEALLHLHQYSIPLVLTTSKTRTEIENLQKRLGLQEAFISENGGAIFFPPGHSLPDHKGLQQIGRYRCKQFGRPYTFIREIFLKFKNRYTVKGFGDMSIEEIMATTGLGREDAIMAAQRDFTEPFLFLAQSRPRKLREEVAPFGLTITRGGRFFHLMSADQDKGRAVIETTRLFQSACRNRLVTVGLGDTENDHEMLKVVDIPVLIPKPDGSFSNLDIQGLRKAPYPGSRGWGAAVTKIFDELASGDIMVDQTALSK